MSVQDLNKKACVGCEACAQKCPSKSIEMKKDAEGFYYPIIDDSICTNCALCESVCPIIQSLNVNYNITNAYVAYDYSVDRLNSSSGGVFAVLAHAILINNGIVFGAQWKDDWTAEHIEIRTHNDLLKLRGSKYIQSRIENTYIQAEKYLKEGRKVLFSGTGCQIAGLKLYLGKEYDDLFTIDVFCHGVPSINVWKAYLIYLEKQKKAKVESVNLRYKEIAGWEKYETLISLGNGETVRQPASDDPFMRLFLSNGCLRPSCYKCRFKNIHRCSDISLGDAWGINLYCPEMNDNKGISAVLIHSPKGQFLFEYIEKQLCSKKVDVNDILPITSDARRELPVPKIRKKIMNRIKKDKDFDIIYSCLKPTLITRFKYKMGLVKKAR